MGKYLVNQTFAAEWGFPLDRGAHDVIPNDLSDPNLQDGWLPPVSRCLTCNVKLVTLVTPVTPRHKLCVRAAVCRMTRLCRRHFATA